MKSMFVTNLDFHQDDNDRVYILDRVLAYYSEYLGDTILVQAGFYTDLASVPRIPIIYSLFGDRAHHESVIHDYLYRKDSIPVVSKSTADRVFFEAMKTRRKSKFIRYPMNWGVKLFGGSAYHKRKVRDKL